MTGQHDFGCFMRVAHRNAPDYRISGLLELLATFWQNGFLSEVREKGTSENRRVFIGDLNGGPAWTRTTDLALIRVAWLGFTTTYKTAGTAKLRGSRTRHRMLWVGLWVGKVHEFCG